MAILTHKQFGRCTQRGNRRSTHLYAFYGFIALFVVTIYAVLDIYLFPALGIDSVYPFNLIHPLDYTLAVDQGGKVMSRKHYSAERIVNELREADVLIAKGQAVAQACKRIAVTGFTYYRWRKEYVGPCPTELPAVHRCRAEPDLCGSTSVGPLHDQQIA